jgi:hypothetical protein
MYQLLLADERDVSVSYLGLQQSTDISASVSIAAAAVAGSKCFLAGSTACCTKMSFKTLLKFMADLFSETVNLMYRVIISPDLRMWSLPTTVILFR